MTTLKFGGFWDWTGSISWNLVIWHILVVLTVMQNRVTQHWPDEQSDGGSIVRFPNPLAPDICQLGNPTKDQKHSWPILTVLYRTLSGSPVRWGSLLENARTHPWYFLGLLCYFFACAFCRTFFLHFAVLHRHPVGLRGGQTCFFSFQMIASVLFLRLSFLSVFFFSFFLPIVVPGYTVPKWSMTKCNEADFEFSSYAFLTLVPVFKTP